MAVVSHGARQLRRGIGIPRHGPVSVHSSRSIHIPAFTPHPNPSPPSTTQRIISQTRTFFSRLVSHLAAPGLSHPSAALPAQPSLIRPTQFSNSQSINARLSLPVKHALSRPFSPPRLPKPPAVPANVTQVGLGTARAFHSGRPIFQNMVDNVPVATRALWEAEWDVKMKKKEARRMRRATQNKALQKSQEMLKPKPKPLVESQCDTLDLDAYLPVEPTPAVTTHLLIPLAPTPTTRLPLSTRTDNDGAHPLLPISDLASIHTSHRLHSLRVSTLFARLDTANVWDDSGVSVDAYAFGPRGPRHDTQEKQCTVLRVTFRGWNAVRVRAILGDSAEWYSLEETHPDGHPTFVPLSDLRGDVQMNTRSESPELESVELDSSWAFEGEMDDLCAVLSAPPMRASASARHDLVLPTIDISSAVSDTPDSVPQPPQPVIFLRTVSELTRDVQPISSSSSVSTTPSIGSWDSLGLSSSFLQRVGEHRRDEVAMEM
ncbi:hypothetical protein J3R82DRAFT_5374 [Butyriboletus roseoflavus]|nr:hypothetical protein J3R82DRAFT_5374 [Butyriboletus roseoflavus]